MQSGHKKKGKSGLLQPTRGALSLRVSPVLLSLYTVKRHSNNRCTTARARHARNIAHAQQPNSHRLVTYNASFGPTPRPHSTPGFKDVLRCTRTGCRMLARGMQKAMPQRFAAGHACSRCLHRAIRLAGALRTTTRGTDNAGTKLCVCVLRRLARASCQRRWVRGRAATKQE